MVSKLPLHRVGAESKATAIASQAAPSLEITSAPGGCRIRGIPRKIIPRGSRNYLCTGWVQNLNKIKDSIQDMEVSKLPLHRVGAEYEVEYQEVDELYCLEITSAPGGCRIYILRITNEDFEICLEITSAPGGCRMEILFTQRNTVVGLEITSAPGGCRIVHTKRLEAS